ncbi:MAG TPA: FAD-dependent oxidoreductase [Acidimicrobiia bacterium]
MTGRPRDAESSGPRAIVAVDSDSDARACIQAELTRRYGSDFQIVCRERRDDTELELTRLRDAGVSVALVLAASPGGAELLSEAARLHPDSKRALLVEFGAWGDPEIASEIRSAIASGCADYYVLKPSRHADALFHRSVSEFLHEHSRANPSAEPREFVVIAPRWSPRGHEIRRLLAGNGIPHVFYEAGSPGARRLLDERDLIAHEEPVVITVRGDVLVDPTDAELARNYGVTTALEGRSEFDLVVVGAGPAGLAAAISAAAEGLSVLVVECAGIGGQASSSSRIRNYPGFSRGVSGAELAQRAYQQAWAFGVEFLHMREVTGLREEGGRYVVEVPNEPDITAAAVVLAVGVAYRRSEIPGIEALLGRGVYYGASVSEAGSVAGGDVFVIGGGNSAGQAALHLARSAAHVTLTTRRSSLADTMSQYLRDEIAGVENITVRTGCSIVDGGGDQHLEWIEVCGDDGTTQRVGADAVFLFIGGVPRTQWLPSTIARDDAGYVLTGNDAATLFETSLPGVFAVGDVRAHSVKRVASAVGEGSIVVPYVLARVAAVAAARSRVDS